MRLQTMQYLIRFLPVYEALLNYECKTFCVTFQSVGRSNAVNMNVPPLVKSTTQEAYLEDSCN
jgi:hypothetical protein